MPKAQVAEAGESNTIVKTEAGGAAMEIGLKADQIAALGELAQGKSVSDAARTAGVARLTIYRWLKTDPAFRAAYNQWHEEMEERTRSRLLIIASEKATTAVERALEEGDAKTAMELLKQLGIIKPREERLTEAADVKKRGGIGCFKT